MNHLSEVQISNCITSRYIYIYIYGALEKSAGSHKKLFEQSNTKVFSSSQTQKSFRAVSHKSLSVGHKKKIYRSDIQNQSINRQIQCEFWVQCNPSKILIDSLAEQTQSRTQEMGKLERLQKANVPIIKRTQTGQFIIFPLRQLKRAHLRQKYRDQGSSVIKMLIV